MVRAIVRRLVSVCRNEQQMQVSVGRAVGVIGFVGFIAIGAHLKIGLPGNPVPLTLQTFFVLLAGAYLGPLDGALALMIYLGIGATGIPIFANTTGATGLAYFSGATGGYLLGFLAAAFLVGFVAERTTSFRALAAAFAGGILVIHALGVVQLAFVLNNSFATAATIGSLPFIPGDIVKAGSALAVYTCVRMYSRGVRRNVL